MNLSLGENFIPVIIEPNLYTQPDCPKDLKRNPEFMMGGKDKT